MFESIQNYITTFEYNSTIAIWLYWIPVITSLIFNGLEFFRMYTAEVAQRAEAIKNEKYFHSRLSVSDIVGAIFTPWIPVFNIFGALGHIFSTFSWMWKFLDLRLVPSYTPPSKKD
jgi:hypothetical protein